MAGKRFSAEERVTKSLGLLLYDIEDFSGIVALGIILHNISLLGGDDHADLLGPSRNHSLYKIFRDGLGPLNSIHHARAYRQQFLGTAQRLNALSGTCGGNNSNHQATSLVSTFEDEADWASSKYCSNCFARTVPVCSSIVRRRAHSAICCSSSS